MDEPIFRPEPPDGEAVWRVGPDEKVRFLPPGHLLVSLYLLVPIALSATLGTMTFGVDESHVVAVFWPAAAFQVVLPIWFGIFGLLPGVVGPMLGNALLGAPPSLFIAGNAVQCLVAALWFRYRRLDPRLRSNRDWFGLIIVGCVIGNGLGALTGAGESILRHALADEIRPQSYYMIQFLRWFVGNALPCIVLAPALLKAGSPMIVRGPIFCQRFWGKVDRGFEGQVRSGKWDDLPLYGKLMMLVLVAGLVPVYAIGGLTVWSTLDRASYYARWSTQWLAYENRNDIERHIELLRGWACEYDRPDYSDELRREKLASWRARDDAYRDLVVTERRLVERLMSPRDVEVLDRFGVSLFVVPDPLQEDLEAIRGVATLPATPDKVLTGIVVWREEGYPLGNVALLEGFLVLDDVGSPVYSRGPPELNGVPIPEESFQGQPRLISHAGTEWYLGEALIADPPLRLITITSALAGRIRALRNMPIGLTLLVDLAIFGSLIAGMSVARGLGERVLEIADRLQTSDRDAEPVNLDVPVRGGDEIGYLARTLNNMSGKLAAYLQELRATTAEKERLAREMELAREVQQSVLPKRPPEVQGYELAALSRPAMEVGGDFYDMFLTGGRRLALMIGDAVGKGLGAAMLTTETRGIARAAALDGRLPDRVLAVTNQAMVSEGDKSGRFVTMFCAQLSPSEHHLVYASAGHNPPLFVRNGRTTTLELGGFPLAVAETNPVELFEVTLEPGDCLVMYTDGITEATNEASQMFQTERLAEVVQEHAAASAQHLIVAVLDEVSQFTNDAPQADDMTLLVIRRLAD